MNQIAIIGAESLPSLIDRAASALSNARTAAEVLEARDFASVAYDAAKKAARISRAKHAHDELIAAAHRAQAHALQIESQAKMRLADEYDAAQERGEVAGHGGARNFNVQDGNVEATAADIGISRRDIHEARIIRDAERAEPGIVQRALDARLNAGEEPTKAHLREIVTDAAMRGLRGNANGQSRRNPDYRPSAQWDAMIAVSGGCLNMMEKVRGCGPEYIVGGFTDEGMRRRNLAAIRKCRDYLTLVLEAADAE
jgi:hypothetical protein